MRAALAVMKHFFEYERGGGGGGKRLFQVLGFYECKAGQGPASSIGAPRLQEEPIPTMSRLRDGD